MAVRVGCANLRVVSIFGTAKMHTTVTWYTPVVPYVKPLRTHIRDSCRPILSRGGYAHSNPNSNNDNCQCYIAWCNGINGYSLALLSLLDFSSMIMYSDANQGLRCRICRPL